MVAYPFCPSWAAVGEQVTAGYAAFFFSLYRTQLSVIAPIRPGCDNVTDEPVGAVGHNGNGQPVDTHLSCLGHREEKSEESVFFHLGGIHQFRV
jgi:hypothetical protein